MTHLPMSNPNYDFFEVISRLPECSAYIKDHDYRCVAANSYLFKDLCGFTNFNEVYKEDDRILCAKVRTPQKFCLFDAIRKEDTNVIQYNQRLINKLWPPLLGDNGKVIVQCTTKVPFRDESNTVAGLIGTSFDVAEQVKSLVELRDLYENFHQDKAKAHYFFLKYVLQSDKYPELHALSSAEIHCLLFTETCFTLKSIAKALGCSDRTVETHFGRIREKWYCDTKEAVMIKFKKMIRSSAAGEKLSFYG